MVLKACDGEIVRLDDKARIHAFLRTDPYLHLYSIGDLDDFFWDRTAWYGLMRDDDVRSVLLIYEAPSMPVLLALEDREPNAATSLLSTVLPGLPPRFYAHLSPGLDETLGQRYTLMPHGRYKRMKLADPSALALSEPRYASSTRILARGDLDRIHALYRVAYPDNWFDPRMVETQRCFGAFFGDDLVAIAGVHVLSITHDVAALGNIATHPAHRGKGYASSVTASLCRSLLREVRHVGLNVRADNEPAIRCYEGLGFRMHSDYDEYTAYVDERGTSIDGDGRRARPAPMSTPRTSRESGAGAVRANRSSESDRLPRGSPGGKAPSRRRR